MHPTRNNMPEATGAKMVDLLSTRFADAIDLYAQAKQAHWNVKGPQFIALDELFDKVADAVEEGIAELVERAVALAGTAEGTPQSVVLRASLAPHPDLTAGAEHVGRLADALATYARNVRAAIDAAAEAREVTGGADVLFTEQASRKIRSAALDCGALRR
jgi:starvation-inducible DNA-binding protein